MSGIFLAPHAHFHVDYRGYRGSRADGSVRAQTLRSRKKKKTARHAIITQNTDSIEYQFVRIGTRVHGKQIQVHVDQQEAYPHAVRSYQYWSNVHTCAIGRTSMLGIMR